MSYTLLAEHDHLIFEPIELWMTPALTHLPPMTFSKMHLCGKVTKSPHEEVKIILENATEKRVEFVDEDGEYCFEVKPDKYKVIPVIMQGTE